MTRTVRATLALFVAILLSLPALASGGGENGTDEEGLPAAVLVNPNIPCKSAILMEPSSGRILFEKDADLQMPPASITKIMTLLLVVEAIDAEKIKLDDPVTCSPHASSMGGTQIWFEAGEQMSVHDLLKATAIASANDASVALGELVAGSEDNFVDLMNRRATALGMKNTVFKNATGLDAEGHLSTARDIALMSVELLRHPMITQYTTVWMDSLRDGKTQLVNTNKLIRFYKGATGLKTGTTSGAGSCLSATATRNGLSLVAVVLGADTSDNRFGSARGLLDYGFANFEEKPLPEPEPPLGTLPVTGGVRREVGLIAHAPESMLIEKGTGTRITQRQTLVQSLAAPVAKGDKAGTIAVLLDGVIVSEYDVVTAEAIDIMTFHSALLMLWASLSSMG
ncbi:MAG: D-alanyl-D-alanine carboxypeptidase family protein [Oscillospiraceae bacterium]